MAAQKLTQAQLQERLRLLQQWLSEKRLIQVLALAEDLKPYFNLQPEFHYIRAKALFELNDFNNAEQAINTALKLNDRIPPLYMLKAQIMKALEEPNEQQAALKTLLTLAPGNAAALISSLVAFREQGQYAHAQTLLDKLLTQEHSPQVWATVFYYWSLMRTPKDDDPLHAKLTALVNSQDLPAETKALAGFALGNIRLSQTRHDPAFMAYSQANHLLHQRRKPDNPDPADLVQAWSEQIPPERFKQPAEFGVEDNSQLFVLGVSRSGKSLVESLLACHPQTHTQGESRNLFWAVREQLGSEYKIDNLHSYLADAIPDDARRAAAAVVEGLPVISERYRVNTIPSNMWLMPLVGLWFPNTPIIFCRRGLADHGLSVFFKHYRQGNRYGFDLYDTGRYICAYEQLIDYLAEHLPNPIYQVHYEDLVQNPEKTVQQLYDFLGLDYDPAYLKRMNVAEKAAEQRHMVDSMNRPAPITADQIGMAGPFMEYLDPLFAGYDAQATGSKGSR